VEASTRFKAPAKKILFSLGADERRCSKQMACNMTDKKDKRTKTYTGSKLTREDRRKTSRAVITAMLLASQAQGRKV